MDLEHEHYTVDDEIAASFSKTTVTRDTCDGLAKDLVGGGQVVPVAVQGVSFRQLLSEDSEAPGQEPLLVYVMTRIHGMSKLHMKNGWIRYEDYDDLVGTFWKILSDEVGGLDKDTTRAIGAARVLGLLRSWAFTSRLADEPAPVPI
ncbi:hypothetical protein B0T18DRAFT_393657 [Schizothecium vesticola]|uniref:Uncharacterized protein n=1 Tax=Schizothecium vesticola TaxID=314040 RepID=A0AA40EKC4_9PEZI|nr:hypothetical protein B0T18DRAFT_393657 [Schizothecium vesticola]